MAADTIDELGPVDYVVVEFPHGQPVFAGELARELAALVEAELIRVLDLLIIEKDEDGRVEGHELAAHPIEQLGSLCGVEAQLAEILAEEDVEHLAAAMEPGTVAGVVVWENLWAAPFAAAARDAGGQLVASGRIPLQAILASMEPRPADEARAGQPGADAPAPGVGS